MLCVVRAWAGMKEMRSVQEGMVKTRADLLCELIGVCVIHHSP
jgi:hypothetical protein